MPSYGLIVSKKIAIKTDKYYVGKALMSPYNLSKISNHQN